MLPAIRSIRSSIECTQASASSPVSATIRRTPAAMPPSETILNRPTSPERRTWVPPHSSTEWPPNESTRTGSSYLSPKSATAPLRFASSSGMISVRASSLPRIHDETSDSMRRISSRVTGS